MNEYDFGEGSEWETSITVNASCLTFSKKCISLLGAPKYISIGIDNHSKTLAILALNNTQPDKRCYIFATNKNQLNPIRISSFTLLSKIKQLYSISSRKKIKLSLRWDEQLKLFVVGEKICCP